MPFNLKIAKHLNAEWMTMVILFVVVTILASVATFAVQRSHQVANTAQPRKIPFPSRDLLSQCRQFYKKSRDGYVLVEFTDYECPACKYMDREVEQLVRREGERLNYAVLNYPLPQHEHATELAVYVTAKGLEGEFWKTHSEVMRVGAGNDQMQWGKDNPPGSPGRDAAAKYVLKDVQLARTLNVMATPSYFLCTKDGSVYKLSSVDQARLLMDKGL